MTVVDFGRDRQGTVGVIFALLLVPLLGLIGAALDYSRMTAMQQSLRSTSDQLALAIASSDDPSTAESMKTKIETSLQARYPGRNVRITGQWIDVSNYKVTVSGNLDLSVAKVIPGVGDVMPISLATVARRTAPKMRALPPTSSLLEPEAADYNRAYMYCFDPARRYEADKGRRDFWPIADNASPSTDFRTWYETKAASNSVSNGNGNGNGNGNSNGNGNGNGNGTGNANSILGLNNSHQRNGDGTARYRLPDCRPGEFPSYMMRNVRNSRSTSSAWDRNNDYYEYFTDTEIDPATYRMTNNYVGEYVNSSRNRSPVDLTNRPMLETILCDSALECRPTTQGGKLLPRRTNRSPETAASGCTRGKFMYFGYEDRPGGDRDYDDIRIIISCPEWEEAESKKVRIVE